MLGRKICKKEGHIMDSSWDICPVCLAPICGWLVAVNKVINNEVYVLHEGKMKIGTGDDCEVKINRKTISRHHAMLVSENGKYQISDLNSKNGTFVNNFQIYNRQIIDGDIIKFGDAEFKFKCL